MAKTVVIVRRATPCLVMTALLVTGCGGGDDAATTTTTAITITAAPATTSTTLAEQGEILVGKGDAGPLVASLQFLLGCNGFEEIEYEGATEALVVDGIYGNVTGAFVAEAQQSLGFRPDAAGASGRLLLALGAACDRPRPVEMPPEQMTLAVEAYLDDGIRDRVSLVAAAGQTITVSAEQPLTLGVTAPSGTVVAAPAATTRVIVETDETGPYLIEATAPSEGRYRYTIEMPPHASALHLQSTGLDFVDFGDPVGTTLEVLVEVLGEPTADGGWTRDGACLNHREVTFGDDELVVVFTDAGAGIDGEPTFAAEGTEHFAAWRVRWPGGATSLPAELTTPSGLAAGDPASAVTAVYGDRVEVEGTTFSILDGIITGELVPAGDGSEDLVVGSMRSGAVLCPGSG
jgi:peptidoglycan hydrolase-like protein with peptidoglycan-binding domain